ncbi:Exodeoxyribonuclease 7 large subunit [compost metagenome]
MMQPTERLDRLTEQLGYRIQQRLGRSAERYMKLERALSAFNPKEQIVYASKRLDNSKRQLATTMQSLLRAKRQQWQSKLRHLDALSPLKIMQRGYSLAYDEQGKTLIRSAKQVQIGDVVRIQLKDGRLDCQVKGMEEKTDG